MRMTKESCVGHHCSMVGHGHMKCEYSSDSHQLVLNVSNENAKCVMYKKRIKEVTFRVVRNCFAFRGLFTDVVHLNNDVVDIRFT
jgi:hypothetical protein